MDNFPSSSCSLLAGNQMRLPSISYVLSGSIVGIWEELCIWIQKWGSCCLNCLGGYDTHVCITARLFLDLVHESLWKWPLVALYHCKFLCSMLELPFLKCKALFEKAGRQRKGEEERASEYHSPNARNSQALVRPKPGACSSIQDLHMANRDLLPSRLWSNRKLKWRVEPSDVQTFYFL